ncbi:efflux RND transporter periplasmic adaptor subunit [Psychromonas sp. CD1]|uniref:efflux RND transporter periplasmic adaptor subunit n=1 Tax=Psychromonas sp. CD1 TaxID=1979839 RepID=UPI000B9C301E|nr:efflux RND transporter periplasmic adaptor subunit [Psychromonas sp. CD1]
MRYIIVLLSTIIIGFLVFENTKIFTSSVSSSENVKSEALYWVAPMDANYRRDKPGKSPMGMDLVPVYRKSDKALPVGEIQISPQVENSLGVRSALLKKEKMELAINGFGTIVANKDAQWQINSRVSGWIEKLYVKSEGISVDKGQKLYAIYSPELVKAQESLFNSIDLNNDTLINASKIRLEALGVSDAQINDIIKTGNVQKSITFFAPQKGTILELKVNKGAFISPSMTVIKAVNLDSIWVDVEIFSAQVAYIKLGVPASMTLTYFPGKEWLGKVDFIYPEMSVSNRSLRIRLKFKNSDNKLKPNMFASISLTPMMQGKRLFITQQAIIYAENNARVVKALGGGKFKSVFVTLGVQSQNKVEVLSGLREGDRIVTSAQFLLDSESNIGAELERMQAVKPMQNKSLPELEKSFWNTQIQQVKL